MSKASDTRAINVLRGIIDYEIACRRTRNGMRLGSDYVDGRISGLVTSMQILGFITDAEAKSLLAAGNEPSQQPLVSLGQGDYTRDIHEVDLRA